MNPCMLGENIVLSDTSLAEFGFVSRLAYQAPNQYDKLDAYPSTRRINSEILRDGNYVGGFSNIHLQDAAPWMQFLESIETPAQWKAMWVQQFGWHNFGDMGVVEYLTFINNLVWVERIEQNKAYIRSLCLEDAPPNILTNFWDAHTMNFFSVITRDGHIISSDAGWVRTLIIRREKTERMWIDTKYLSSTVASKSVVARLNIMNNGTISLIKP